MSDKQEMLRMVMLTDLPKERGMCCTFNHCVVEGNLEMFCYTFNLCSSEFWSLQHIQMHEMQSESWMGRP